MDYRKHYYRLIKRARGRILVGYSERHHIKPKCMGGDDSPWNIVRLTPEEHYVAHQLLVKIHPGNVKLLIAAMRMTGKPHYRNPGRNNKLYGWLRRRFVKSQIGRKVSKATRLRQSLAHKGKPLSQAQVEANRRRIGFKPNLNQLRGLAKGRTKKARAKAAKAISIAKKGIKQTPEHIQAAYEARKWYVPTKLHKQKTSLALRGIKRSAETRQKMSESRKRRFAELRAAGIVTNRLVNLQPN